MCDAGGMVAKATKPNRIYLERHDKIFWGGVLLVTCKHVTRGPQSIIFISAKNCKIILNAVTFLNVKMGYGGIAQLGERLNGIQEVSGSIPLISTKKQGLMYLKSA